MQFRRFLLAATTVTAILGAAPAFALVASAGPVVNDPNFNQTATTDPSYYGLTAWGATTDTTAPTYNGNNSFAGVVSFDPNNQWDNGTPGNGQTKVGFIANNGYISQSISGFTVGDSYVITLLANGRVVAPPAIPTLTITVAPPSITPTVSFLALALTPPATVYSGALPPVDTVSSQVVPFQTITSNSFVATSGTELVTLSNTGSSASSILLSGFAVQDVGLAVPEPVSMTLLGTGLLGLALVRRRR